MEYEDRFLILSEHLEWLDGRRRKAEARLWAPRGLLIGLVVALIVAILTRLLPLVDNRAFFLITGVLAFLGLASSLLITISRRRKLLAKARYADQELLLQERASTAVEIHTGELTVLPSIGMSQLIDTLEAIANIDRTQVLPFRWRWREMALLMLVVVFLIVAGLTPNPQNDILEEQRAISQAIETQIEALEDIEQTMERNELIDRDFKDRLQAPIKGAIEELGARDLNREQAVAVLSEAEADLRDLNAEFNNDAIQRSLMEAGWPLTENSAGQQLGESLASGDLFGASKSAFQLADSINTLNEEEQTVLAQDLARTAAALQDVDSELTTEFIEAAQALQSRDVEAAQEALREAAATLQQRAQEEAAASMAASAATQLDQSGQQVARAGQQDEAGGQGENQASTGSNPGQNTGEGESQGQGPTSGDPSEQGQGPGGPGPGGGRAESVFVPDPLEIGPGEGIDIELPAECAGDLEGCGALLSESAVEFGDEQSLVPYQQVFADYRDAAFEALEGDYIPLGMKDYIREYFTILEP